MNFYEFKETENQVNIFNERWYRVEINGEIKWFKNVTTILDIIDKGEGFRQYLKQSGFRADYILAKAGEFGDIFHDITARFDSGEKISHFHLRERFNDDIATELWKRILRYAKYIKSVEGLEFLHIEKIVYSLKYEYAGTADRIVKIGDNYEVWDIKTGNDIYETYFLQLSAYAQAIKETLGYDITSARILWFPDKKQEIDENGKVSYKPNKKGYRIVTINKEEIDHYFDLFLATKKLYEHFRKEKPSFLTLPLSIQKDEDLSWLEI